MSAEAIVSIAALFVTVFALLAGVIYNAGRVSARLDAIEQWRTETVADLKIIRGVVENISGAISARRVP